MRNPGLASLENSAGLNSGELGSIRDAHYNYVVNTLGIRNHDHYKELKAQGGTSQKIVDDANASALNAQKMMAKKVADGLTIRASQNPEFLRSYVRDSIAPQTKFQHFRLHARTDDKGGATYHMSDMQDDAAKLNDFDDFRVVPHDGKSITYRIEGRRKGSADYEPVLEQSIKKGSGPLKGFAGITKAPFLTKVDKKIGSLVAGNKPARRSRKNKSSIIPPATTAQNPEEPIRKGLIDNSHSGMSMYSPIEKTQLQGQS